MLQSVADSPELRHTANGVAVAGFRLAVTPRVKDPDGSWRNGDTSFFTVNCWRDMAEHVAQSLHKGDRTVAVGRLRTRSWVNEAGEKRSVTELEADEIAPSLKFHTVKEITKPERTRAAAGRDASRADALDEPPF